MRPGPEKGLVFGGKGYVKELDATPGSDTHGALTVAGGVQPWAGALDAQSAACHGYSLGGESRSGASNGSRFWEGAVWGPG